MYLFQDAIIVVYTFASFEFTSSDVFILLCTHLNYGIITFIGALWKLNA
jgi:hypothetical protein